MNHRSILLSAGLLGLTGVALGAFGAHALKESLLERGMSTAWETGSRYQLIHAVALLAAAGWSKTSQGAVAKRVHWAATAWTAGIVLFSGSLYALALGGPRWLGPVTPLGGLALLAGWLCLVWAALSKES